MRTALGKFKSYNINEKSFSDIENIQSCYWAGFIAADGNLRKRGPKELSIMLNIKDLEHLKKFKAFLKFEGEVKIKEYKSTGKVCRLSITNKFIYEDLINNFNITPQKSLTLQPPTKLTKNQSLAFIAGYIDGDGHIATFLTKGRTVPQLKMDILGTENVLNWIKNEFNLKDKKLLKLKNVYRFSVGGNTLTRTILEPIKNLGLPLLQRKWDLV